MRRARRVRHGSACKSRPCMVPWLQYPRPNVAGEFRTDVSFCQIRMRGIEREPKRQRPERLIRRISGHCRFALAPVVSHRSVVPYPTNLFDTFCRLVDRYFLDPGDEVEHRALGATAEAIEYLALEMDRAGWPPVRVEGTAAPYALVRRRGFLHCSGRGSARRMLLPSRERDTAAARS